MSITTSNNSVPRLRLKQYNILVKNINKFDVTDQKPYLDIAEKYKQALITNTSTGNGLFFQIQRLVIKPK